MLFILGRISRISSKKEYGLDKRQIHAALAKNNKRKFNKAQVKF